jgi:hypothetical protein
MVIKAGTAKVGSVSVMGKPEAEIKKQKKVLVGKLQRERKGEETRSYIPKAGSRSAVNNHESDPLNRL